MIVTFILHLVVDERTAGRLVGDVEDVESGERSAVRSAEELTAWLRGRVDSGDQAPETIG